MIMKKGLKKLGAAFLALVMLLSCFAGVLTVSAQDPKTDDLKQTAQTAMTAFEDNITDGKAYVGMSKAYDAYVALNKALDQYYYGHYQGAPDDSAVTEAISALEEATEAMTEYKGYTVTLADGALDESYTKAGLFPGGNDNGGDEYIEADEMSNVIATYGVSSSAPSKDATAASQLTGAQYGAIVFLYDGENDMATPVNLYYKRTSAWAGDRRTRYLYPTTDDFELRHRWHGESETAEYQNHATNTGIGFEDGDENHASSKNKSNNTYQSNTLYYIGKLANDEFTRTIDSVSWHFQRNGNDTGDFTVDAPIYIINYKAVSGKIDEVMPGVLEMLKSVANYKQGGLKNVIDAFDKAISCDPNSYFTGISAGELADAGNTAVTDIEAIMEALNGDLTAEAEVDYTALRTAIDNAKDAYFNEAWTEADGASNPVNGLNNKYCADFWAAFKSAYEAACDLINDNYGDDAAEVTKALTEAVLTEHKASEDSKVVVPEDGDYEDATCGDAGLGQRISECPNCGKDFLVEDNVEIPATGEHDYKGVQKEAPTCTKMGTTTYTCTVCGDSYDAEDIPTTKHTYNFDGDPDEIREATCVTPGAKIYYCTVCKGEPTEVAGEPATGKHTFDYDSEGTVLEAATCGKAGIKQLTCTVCNEATTEAEIPATGLHTEDAPIVEERDGVKYDVVYCSVCKQELRATLHEEESTTDPDEPTTDPDEPTTDPDEPTTDPDEPTTDPDEPTTDPDEPTTDPDEPTTDPDEPTTDPDEPTTDPDEPTTDTDEPTTEPETSDDPTVPSINPEAPEILEVGTDSVYVIGSDNGATIHCTGALEEFVKVLVDGIEIDESCYTLAEGSTLLTFTSDYLDTLTPGDHNVTLVYTYAEVSTLLTVKENAADESTTEPTTAAPAEESTTEAPAEESTTAAKPEGNGNGTSPVTGADIALPMFAATAMAGCFVLIAAKKKKAEDAE